MAQQPYSNGTNGGERPRRADGARPSAARDGSRQPASGSSGNGTRRSAQQPARENVGRANAGRDYVGRSNDRAGRLDDRDYARETTRSSSPRSSSGSRDAQVRRSSQAYDGSARGGSARGGSSGRPAGSRQGSRPASASGAGTRRRAGLDPRLLILVALLVALFFVIRGVAGCVGNILSTENEAPAPVEEEAPEQELVKINLVMFGDVLQHSGIFNSGYQEDGTRNYDHVFAHVGDVLKGADIKVVNQETVLGGESLGFSGYPSFNGPQEMGDAEAKAGFNVILRATNHAMDYGYDGLHNEMSFWHESHPDVAVIGAIDPEDEGKSVDDAYYIFEKDGFTVALLNYTYDLNGYDDPKNCVSILEEERVRRTVSEADAEADMVVVFPHWGEEYNLSPTEEQRHMAEVFIEAGADVIIGGHPHVIEPVEILTASDGRKVPCFWSVGNFISTQIDNDNLVGGIACVTLAKQPNGECQVTAASFEPTVTHKGTSTDMTTYLLRDYTDEMAESNYLLSNDTDNTSLTVAWADEFCGQVLGEWYDAVTQKMVVPQEELLSSEQLEEIEQIKARAGRFLQAA